MPVGLLLEPRAVLERGVRVVDRAGPDDGEQPVVGAGEDADGGAARADDGLQRRRGRGDLGGEERGLDERVLPEDSGG
jgi:hypothetical protein